MCEEVREGCEGERGVRCVSCVRGRAKRSHREREQCACVMHHMQHATVVCWGKKLAAPCPQFYSSPSPFPPPPDSLPPTSPSPSPHPLLTCQLSSAHCATPVAPRGCPFDMRPPLGLTTQRPPYVTCPSSINRPPCPSSHRP